MPRGPDLKWRFFWRVGPRPAAGGTRYAELNAAPVTPKARLAPNACGAPHRMKPPLPGSTAGLSAVDRGYGLLGPAHDECSDKRC